MALETDVEFIRTFCLGEEEDPTKAPFIETVISAIENESPGAFALARRLGPVVRVSDDEPLPAAMPPTIH
jgi:hypothetical protein